MRRAELAIAIDWAAAEGWNPGLHDADCYHAADPDGFLIGLLGDEPIAVISVVKYGAGFGFLGFYIVRPQYRGQGYGLRLWNAGLAYLAGRTVGLDGVVEQQGNYAKSGFALAHANVRYQGLAGGEPRTDAEIVPLSSLPFADLCAYDRPFFPESRAEFLRHWIAQPESTALGILGDRQLAGYAVLRRCRSGYKIGPLFADTAELAERLFLALRAAAPAGAEIFLDVPATNAAAVAMAQRHGMTVSFETARMYRGTVPTLPLGRIFGITSFELG
ncbi:GNAT family N-acetyltransferase [Pseudomonas lalucatii]|uniref:GNAT family N-acetyltransferase n=2 Tax=Pseudomonas lalucatii TaxID=1424203 RepID=A0ABS5PVM0_9PSED|nr:GNAT family N-acetyltransferase [Pseudomonas lalucatii]MBS7660580.1 GNAT family N-acetyltransferase [Pseudomonas lalucatii]QVM88978.1 GNAT family N-acetyltransferase [Pseudomonas lalucatii]